jgi:large subunit ribosomal protein L18
MASNNRKQFRRNRIKMRIRKIIKGTAERPRMTVFRSNKQIYVQLINDLEGHTLLSVSSAKEKGTEDKTNKTEQAKMVGKAVALKAKEAGIENVVFDRNGYLYHGRIKALAEAAREGGLKF